MEGISAAAGISRSRGRILDIGLPFQERVKKNAQRLAAANAERQRVTAVASSSSSRVCSPPREPDTGAGVLRFLTDDREAPVADSALSPAPDAATTPDSTRSNESPAPATPPPTTAP